MGRHTPTPPPVITAGEAIRHTWCGICLEPWRIRVPLYVNGQPCGGIEVCPGCGSVHDQPGVYITPPDPDVVRGRERKTLVRPVPLSPDDALLPRLARRLHARACQRSGKMALECAHGTCPWPGLWRHAVPFTEDDGTTTYLFCRKSHRARWAAENDVLL